MMKPALIAGGLIASPVALYLAVGPVSFEPSSASSAFVVPAMSPEAFEGRIDFADACGSCHGNYGEGTDQGPPLIHPVYAPAALNDDRISVVIEHGAAAKRWPFGDMPAVAGLAPGKVENIIRFVREMQTANDIR